MLEVKVIEGLRDYFDVHPLVFHRSLEKATSQGDLFDILSEIPDSCPMIWDDSEHKWMPSDLLQAKGYESRARICFQ
jgi:hypothetical protein